MSSAMGASSNSSSTSTEHRKSNEFSIAHDILCTISYFINIFLFFAYAFLVTNFCNSSLKYLNDKNYIDIPDVSNKYIVLVISILVSYTWTKFYSSSFDGDAFSHILYYRYKIISFREAICRAAGTMAAGALFGYMYYVILNSEYQSNSEQPYEILKKMVDESNGRKTLMDVFVFAGFGRSAKDIVIKEYISKFLHIPALKYEKNYFVLLEKYVALLVDYFFVEFIFCLFGYLLLSLLLSSAKPPSGYLLFCVANRRICVFLSTLLLEHVDGQSALDGAKSMFFYFEDFDGLKLSARLLGNGLASLLVPFVFPLPKVMSLYEYRDIYVNTAYVPKSSVGAVEYPYLRVIKTRDVATGEIRYGKWPSTKLGRLMSHVDELLSNNKGCLTV